MLMLTFSQTAKRLSNAVGGKRLGKVHLEEDDKNVKERKKIILAF